jgi:hypothetical protein
VAWRKLPTVVILAGGGLALLGFRLSLLAGRFAGIPCMNPPLAFLR